MLASNKKIKSSAAVLDSNRILMYELRSGMTWSKAVENDKEQKELLEMNFSILFRFRVYYFYSVRELGFMVPKRFDSPTRFDFSAVACYQEGTRSASHTRVAPDSSIWIACELSSNKHTSIR